MFVTLAAAAVYEFAGTSAWWAELLRFLPFPGYLVPPAIALLASAWLGWPWRLASLGALLLVPTAVMGLAIGRADAGSGPLRLMTWNVKAYEGRNDARYDSRVALEILEHDADLIVMQDAHSYARENTPLPPPIASALGQRQVFRFGQYLVASRLPMRECRQGLMPYRGQTHTFARCVVTAHGTDIDVVTAHLESPRAGLNAARRERLEGLDDWRQNYGDRIEQVHHLVRELAGNPRPLIVAGDLNAVDTSPVLATLREIGLRDAFAQAGLGWGYTLGHALKPRFSFLRIDHVLVSPTIGVHDVAVGSREPSEHRPVIADLWVKRGG